MKNLARLRNVNLLLRGLIIKSTTIAGSGHPSSCLSAVELMSVLVFGGHLRFDIAEPKNLANDRLIFSKGHAAPLLYSLFCAAGLISINEIMNLRKFDSNLEGHPSVRLPFIDVATGSLGQGLSVGAGMALGIKLHITQKTLKIKRTPKVWVLLGDSEITEGQIWEALEIASFHKIGNLVAIVDVNRLGQANETIDGWNIKKITAKVAAFGSNVFVINDGHNLKEISRVFSKVEEMRNGKPTVVLAKTIKGKGVSVMENQGNWHGKPLPKEQLERALHELGSIDFDLKEKMRKPSNFSITRLQKGNFTKASLETREKISTREAYGNALVNVGANNKKLIVLDAEMANSTFSSKFREAYPERFFEMFIAEQNMISFAVGLSKTGFVPFASSFAAFLTRGFDQMRMAGYSKANLKIVGSHAGVSIGQDGPSQMGLEDIGMGKSIIDSVVLCPSDAIAAHKLTSLMLRENGLLYMRTARGETPIIYRDDEEFEIGGSKIHRLQTELQAKALIISIGITLHEALKAQAELAKENIVTVVVDAYSIKPLDESTIIGLAEKITNVVVVEDHFSDGGIGDSISKLIVKNKLIANNFVHLAVNKMPRSGTPGELLAFEEIDSSTIVKKVKSLMMFH